MTSSCSVVQESALNLSNGSSSTHESSDKIKMEDEEDMEDTTPSLPTNSDTAAAIRSHSIDAILGLRNNPNGSHHQFLSQEHFNELVNKARLSSTTQQAINFSTNLLSSNPVQSNRSLVDKDLNLQHKLSRGKS